MPPVQFPVYTPDAQVTAYLQSLEARVAAIENAIATAQAANAAAAAQGVPSAP